MTSAQELISHGVVGRGPEGPLYLVLRPHQRSQSNSALRWRPAAPIRCAATPARDAPGRQSNQTADERARAESPALFLRAAPWRNESPCAVQSGFEGARLQACRSCHSSSPALANEGLRIGRNCESPQRLKPNPLRAAYGTAEAVPFQRHLLRSHCSQLHFYLFHLCLLHFCLLHFSLLDSTYPDLFRLPACTASPSA